LHLSEVRQPSHWGFRRAAAEFPLKFQQILTPTTRYQPSKPRAVQAVAMAPMLQCAWLLLMLHFAEVEGHWGTNIGVSYIVSRIFDDI